MPEAIEYKAVTTEFKAVGDEGQYEGHFGIFGNVDDGGDVSHTGMFLKTILERGRRVKVFYGHDWEKLIGPAPEVLSEDTLGLYAKGKLTLGSFWGNEVWSLMKDNALNEGSYGYEAVKFDFETLGDGRMVRNLREVKLYEISPVPLGMNELTQVRALKEALAKGEPLDVVTSKATALANVLAGLKDGRVLSSANKDKVKNAVSALQAALDVLSEILAAAEPEKEKGVVIATPGHLALLSGRLRAAGIALGL